MESVIIKTIGGSITVGYSGKALGNTQASFGAAAKANFARFTAKFPGKTVYDMPAVGKDNIVNVDSLTPDKLFEMETDALITTNPSALLTLKAADCIPLVFYVPGQKILALAHVGTPGAVLHLPSKTVKALEVNPAKLRCYVGPSISQKSYRFKEEEFSDKKLDPSWSSYITKEPDGVHINLLGYVLDELKSCGLTDENIEIEQIDTGGDPAYFSHRRHKLTGELDGRNSFGVCLL